ncbi:MAG: hypothetical protein AAGI68_06650 [Planctomycetota bacterium]
MPGQAAIAVAFFALCSACLVLSGCGEADKGSAGGDSEGSLTAANTMMRTAKALVAVDAERLKPALRSDVDPAVVERLIAKHTQMSTGYPERPGETVEVENTPESLKRFLSAIQTDFAGPDQSEIILHSATGRELAEYAPDSSAYHFAGGAKTVAQQILNPDTTFYRISYIKPGEERGMSLDLLYWDGQQWSILIKPWRGVLD